MILEHGYPLAPGVEPDSPLSLIEALAVTALVVMGCVALLIAAPVLYVCSKLRAS